MSKLLLILLTAIQKPSKWNYVLSYIEYILYSFGGKLYRKQKKTERIS